MSDKVTPQLVKTLRERTGIGMGKCKEALDQTGGDIEKAIDWLRKAGMTAAVKKEGRETKEGMIAVGETPSAIALVEINAETDFVVQNEKFKQFAKEIAHQAAKAPPKSLESFLQTPSSHDKSLTIDQYRAVVMQALGENIKIKRFAIISKTPHQTVAVYSHGGGKIVTLVEIEGKAKVEALAREIAMHVAAEAPDYLTPDEVPADVKAREEEVARGQVAGKPAQIVAKIVEGKLKAFYEQACLACQKFIKDNSLTITQLIEKESKTAGSPLSLKRFIRWKVGG